MGLEGFCPLTPSSVPPVAEVGLVVYCGLELGLVCKRCLEIVFECGLMCHLAIGVFLPV